MKMLDKLISTKDANNFLESHLKQKVENLQELSGGKHSEAFSYILNDKEYIVRFNDNKRGFYKDKYAFEKFSVYQIKIPEIYEIGVYKESIYYCISEKIDGVTAKECYAKDDFSSLSVQFETIERIRDIPISKEHKWFGEWEPDNSGLYKSFKDYIQALYNSNEFVNWDELSQLPYFDKNFTDYLAEKINKYSGYSDNVRELMHGDFGNDNILLKNGKISGVIDWERSRYGDHFLDVGRVVLYCPSREATVSSALSFYAKLPYENYKERIALGVYFTMLNNYGLAAKDGNRDSCTNSIKRIRQFEQLIGL